MVTSRENINIKDPLARAVPRAHLEIKFKCKLQLEAETTATMTTTMSTSELLEGLAELPGPGTT